MQILHPMIFAVFIGVPIIFSAASNLDIRRRYHDHVQVHAVATTTTSITITTPASSANLVSSLSLRASSNSINPSEEDTITCSICLESLHDSENSSVSSIDDLTTSISLLRRLCKHQDCGHLFCTACIKEWKRKELGKQEGFLSCPNCRARKACYLYEELGLNGVRNIILLIYLMYLYSIILFFNPSPFDFTADN
jgi:hypothetical protein